MSAFLYINFLILGVIVLTLLIWFFYLIPISVAIIIGAIILGGAIVLAFRR